MKRITNFLMLLLLAMCGIGASAQTTVTVCDNASYVDTKGTWSDASNNLYKTWTSGSASGMDGLVITSDSYVMKQGYYASYKYTYQIVGTPGTSNTITLTAPSGYVISGYSLTTMKTSTSSNGTSVIVSAEDGTSTGSFSTAGKNLSVSNVMKSSTYFTVAYTSNNASVELNIFNFEVTLVAQSDIQNYNYTYILANAAARTVTVIEQGNASAQGSSNGYTYTAPTLAGYKFLAAYDPTVSTTVPLDLSGKITASTIYALYTPVLQDLASAVDTCVYTMTTPRGYIYAESADATQFARVFTSTASPDMDNALNQWTFVTLNGNKYLYNVGAQKFATFTSGSTHALVTSLPATVAEETSTFKEGYPFVLTFTNAAGTTRYLNMNASGLGIDTWSTHDEGNVYQVAQVPGVTVTPNAYSVNFTCTGGGLTSVYVDGTNVALGTDVVLTSGATVSSSTTENFIESYNGFATLAEALADANFAGTVDVALSATLTTVTLNVTRDNRVVKTVAIENVPENTEINVVSALGGTPNYVSNISPTTVTSTDVDQTVTVTYDSSLPFELSADPTDATVSTPYFFILRSKYAYGNNVTSSSSYDLANDEYYWTFGGNEFDGITVYNRTYGYMRVGTTDNSVATFDTTPFAFAISPNNNQTDGFNLYVPGTNSYINDRGNKISTWVSSWAATDGGSCLKVFTINDLVLNLIEGLDPYFTYRGFVNALSETDATALQDEYSNLLQNPDYNEYLTFKAKVEGYQMVQPAEGYYLVLSGLDEFQQKQGVSKAMYYNTSNNKIAWQTFNQGAPFVMKLTAADASTFRLYAPLADVYLQAKDGTTTATEADGMTFEVVAKSPSKVALVYNANGGTDAALHTANHNSGNVNTNTGAGLYGPLTGWTTDGGASMWRLMPIDIDEITLISPEGVADGDEVMQGFANANDAQLPLNVGVFTITEDLGAGARLDTIATSQIAADQGYIISGVKGATVPLLPVNGTVDVPAGNLLVAGDGSSVVSGGYILAYKKGEAEAKFWSINGLTVPANRSYLPAGTPTRGLENIFGGIGEDVTGINGITTGAENGTVYDLQGRRVNNATKGVYIINGKKVIK